LHDKKKIIRYLINHILSSLYVKEESVYEEKSVEEIYLPVR